MTQNQVPDTIRDVVDSHATNKINSATAPGKIILFGEHSVVYGQPAIAMPVEAVMARAIIEAADHEGVEIVLLDLNKKLWLHEIEDNHPLAQVIRNFFRQFAEPALKENGLRISLTSTIPMAGGMGSGAALSAALFRALARHYGMQDLVPDKVISQLTYEIEKLYHGTPSGVDNTVVAYNRPVYFVRDLYKTDRKTYNILLGDDGYQLYMPGLDTFEVGGKFSILIADTGIPAPTAKSVLDVRNQWLIKRYEYEGLFIRCGQIANEALAALVRGDTGGVGALMNFNHRVLQAMKVSSPELDALVTAARGAGALGAKLSGGGRGGNMIALVNDHVEDAVRAALLKAGAKSVIKTVLV